MAKYLLCSINVILNKNKLVFVSIWTRNQCQINGINVIGVHFYTSFQTATTTEMITLKEKMTPITGTLNSINLYVCQINLFRLSKLRVYT